MSNQDDRTQASRDLIAGLEKGLKIIELFDETRQRLSISQTAQLAGLTRAAARRYLLTLVHLRYAAFDGKFFSLTPRAMRLGYAYLAATPLSTLLQPLLESVARQSGNQSVAAVLDDTDIVCIAEASPPRAVFVSLTVGSRLPAYRTALGRVLLAHATSEWMETYWQRVRLEPRTPKSIHTREALERELAAVREANYAIVDEEVELGMRTLAVPLRDTRGQVIAAINAVVRASEITLEEMPGKLLPVLAGARDALQRLT